MFLGFGINMWMCLFGPLPMPSWFGNLGKLLYIVAVRLTGAVLGQHLPVVGDRLLLLLPARRRRLQHLAARRPEHRRGGDDGRGVAAHARAVLLAVPARRARGRGAPGAARLRAPERPRADRRARRPRRRGRPRRGAAQAPGSPAPSTRRPLRSRRAPRERRAGARRASYAERMCAGCAIAAASAATGFRSWMQIHAPGLG